LIDFLSSGEKTKILSILFINSGEKYSVRFHLIVSFAFVKSFNTFSSSVSVISKPIFCAFLLNSSAQIFEVIITIVFLKLIFLHFASVKTHSSII
jgi:hypothetical protein